ncbi:hypothetical protein M153_12700016657 [Pseudoloma neurophilia]|uniref:Uncharacterized protein n=1 Tax=Pseudoloma neurophilia TaxID=146866 RepID=A0A0R0M980_9MICR|nr:hypothetical protein M153_12700016657 [Pseudoloma neurophilia]
MKELTLVSGNKTSFYFVDSKFIYFKMVSKFYILFSSMMFLIGCALYRNRFKANSFILLSQIVLKQTKSFQFFDKSNISLEIYR